MARIMYCIHVTEKKNLHSIKKFGLLPTKSFLHSSLMKSKFKTDKVIYLTKVETRENIRKYIEDFVYCKLWIHPRHSFMRKNKINTSDEENKVYSHYFKLEPRIFSILSIDFIPRGKYIIGTHEQSDFFGLKDIDERFTHDDKPLIIAPKKIAPIQIKEIGNAYPVIRNNRIENIKLEGWE